MNLSRDWKKAKDILLHSNWLCAIITSISVDDISMLFRPRLFRCWSTAHQSPLTDSARMRFKISHRKTEGFVLVSYNNFDPLRACEWTTDISDVGLGGRNDGLRLVGVDSGAPWFGIAVATKNLRAHRTQRLKDFNTTFEFQYWVWWQLVLSISTLVTSLTTRLRSISLYAPYNKYNK